MYTTNSGIPPTTSGSYVLSDLVACAESIINDYGDLPLYTIDYTLGAPANEVPIEFLDIRSAAYIEGTELPLRITIP